MTEEQIQHHAQTIFDLLHEDKKNKLLDGTPIDFNNAGHVIAAAYSLGCVLTEKALTEGEESIDDFGIWLNEPSQEIH